MKIHHLLSIIILPIAIGCGQNNESKPVTTTLTVKTNPSDLSCYILCDFSASQGDISRSRNVQNADSLFRSGFGKKWRFKYYDISAPELQPPFFETELTTLPNLSRPSDRKKFEQKCKLLADSLHSSMIKLLKSPSSNTTCIIRTIDKVAKSLATEFPGNQHRSIKIAILSDMLEDCAYNSMRIDIDHGYYEAALKTLAKMPKPKFTFLNYKNIEVRLVGSSERTINSAALFNFWQEVFRKYDYELKTPIAVDLPAWISN